MRMRLMLGTLMAGAVLLMAAAPAEAQCEPDGEVQFICGPASPEDLAPVAQSRGSSSPA